MFIGHYDAGLAFNRQKEGSIDRSKNTFFVLVLETQFVDHPWGLLTLLDIEGGNSGGSIDRGSVEHNFFRNSKKFGLFGFINQNKL